MNLTYSIHAGEYFIEVFSSEPDAGSVVVTDVKADDAVLIEPYKNVNQFFLAIKAMKDLVQLDRNTIVQISVGENKWLSTFPITYNWYNATRIGYNTDEHEDPYSLLNQKALRLDMEDFDWLDDEDE